MFNSYFFLAFYPRFTYASSKGKTMRKIFNSGTEITEAVLNTIAHLPTTSLPATIDPSFWKKLNDKDFMRIAVLLAKKSYDEGGCPIGAVIINNKTNIIIGKGHNTLVQENHPYNHGETSAIRDAGRIDFNKTTLFTSLSPCDICTALIPARQFKRVVIGDITSVPSNANILKEKGLIVDILEDDMGIAQYQKYREEKPNLDIEDWKGKGAL